MRLIVAAAAFSYLSTVCSKTYAKELNDSPCSLYMATSSTIEEDEEFKLGMYAGKNFKVGEVIGIPELAVPMTDIYLHNNMENPEEFMQGQINFMWSAESFHANYEVFPNDNDEIDLHAAVGGIGSLGNQHIVSYANAELDVEAPLNKIPSVDRDSPAYLSNSHFGEMTLKANREINAGSEILMNGLRDIPENDFFTGEDFDTIETALKKIHPFIEKYKNTVDENHLQKTYDYLINTVVQSNTKELLEHNDNDADDWVDLQTLIPDKVTEVASYLENGGPFYAEYPEAKKDLAWLEENGQCIDALYTRTSAIPAAGDGAFTRRSFKKDEVITPAPLLLIPEQEYLDKHEHEMRNENGEDELYFNTDGEVVSSQLLKNYCFGHSQSNMLFYPYGVGVNSINHKPTGKGANAKVVWSKAPFYNPEVLELSSDELLEEYYDGYLPIGFDIVALEDIAADEEIFIDYGSEWQDAWDLYIENWDPEEKRPPSAFDYMKSIESSPYFTEDERAKEDPVPENVMSVCYADMGDDDFVEENEAGFKVYNFTVKEPGLDAKIMKQCDVVERQALDDKNSYEYVVRVLEADDVYFIQNMPHKFVRFVDRPYSSAIHDDEGFRHSIAIPDDIFPEAWRDF